MFYTQKFYFIIVSDILISHQQFYKVQDNDSF